MHRCVRMRSPDSHPRNEFCPLWSQVDRGDWCFQLTLDFGFCPSLTGNSKGRIAKPQEAQTCWFCFSNLKKKKRISALWMFSVWIIFLLWQLRDWYQFCLVIKDSLAAEELWILWILHNFSQFPNQIKHPIKYMTIVYMTISISLVCLPKSKVHRWNICYPRKLTSSPEAA